MSAWERLDSVAAFDPRNGRWAHVAAMSVPRSSAGVATLHGRLYSGAKRRRRSFSYQRGGVLCGGRPVAAMRAHQLRPQQPRARRCMTQAGLQ